MDIKSKSYNTYTLLNAINIIRLSHVPLTPLVKLASTRLRLDVQNVARHHNIEDLSHLGSTDHQLRRLDYFIIVIYIKISLDKVYI